MGSFEYKTKSNTLTTASARLASKPISSAVLAAFAGLANAAQDIPDLQWDYWQDNSGKYAELPMSNDKPDLRNHPLQRLGTGIPRLLKDGDICSILEENRGKRMPYKVLTAFEHEISCFSGLEVLDYYSIYSIYNKMTRTVLILGKDVELTLSFFDSNLKEFVFSLTRHNTTLAMGVGTGEKIAKSVREFIEQI